MGVVDSGLNAYVWHKDATNCMTAWSPSALFQPEFQPQGINAVEIVSKESFVTHEAEFLIQVKGCTVSDLGL